VKTGKMIVVSAPSGSGKTTLVKYLLNTFPDLEFSISATTRPSRGKEVSGVDYHFLKKKSFINAIKDKSFIEYEEVYPGTYYGTLKSEIEKIWSKNKIVIFLYLKLVKSANVTRIKQDLTTNPPKINSSLNQKTRIKIDLSSKNTHNLDYLKISLLIISSIK
jgi:guanylate kinase